MSESEEEYDELEEQLRQEKLEKERRDNCSDIEHGRQRVDPDGTVYEWDSVKMAYFPKIDDDFIAQYQMSYGNYTEPGATTATDTAATASTATATTVSTTDTADNSQYEEYYKKYYAEHGCYPEYDKSHQDYYNYYYSYYYGQTAESANKEPPKGSDDKEETEGKEAAAEEGKTDKEESSETAKGDETGDSENPGAEAKKDEESGTADQLKETDGSDEKAYREYYEYCQKYYSHYYDQTEGDAEKEEGKVPSDKTQEDFDYWAWYYHFYGHSEDKGHDVDKGSTNDAEDKTATAKDDVTESKKQKKRKEGWFDIDENKNTNVYVAGLPSDITDDEFKELMNKCGMILYDPRTRKPKLKLYRDAEGNPKGDGLCCYIKSESVELAVQMLDDYDVRGHRISVESARFEMKGHFDPKKRKKLSNREKKKLKEHKEKLFDWRPDKPVGYRGRHERIIILKNLFTAMEFENDPKNIQKLREDVRTQCANHGTVKKVIVYDRHPECVVTVMFAEVEEADMAKEAMNGRYFRGRQIKAETWDGKTKYDVKESDAEKDSRLKKWREFLAEGKETSTSSAENTEGKEKSEGSPVKKDEEGRLTVDRSMEVSPDNLPDSLPELPPDKPPELPRDNPPDKPPDNPPDKPPANPPGLPAAEACEEAAMETSQEGSGGSEGRGSLGALETPTPPDSPGGASTDEDMDGQSDDEDSSDTKSNTVA